MTVKDYCKVKSKEEKITVATSSMVTFEYDYVYRYGGKEKVKRKKEESFSRVNLCFCDLEKWKNYISYNLFANKEIVKIYNNGIYKNMVYVSISREDWLKEIIRVFSNCRNFSILSIQEMEL